MFDFFLRIAFFSSPVFVHDLSGSSVTKKQKSRKQFPNGGVFSYVRGHYDAQLRNFGWQYSEFLIADIIIIVRIQLMCCYIVLIQRNF